MSDRVEVAAVDWKAGLPMERSRRLLTLLFAASPKERDAAEGGEADNDKDEAA